MIKKHNEITQCSQAKHFEDQRYLTPGSLHTLSPGFLKKNIPCTNIKSVFKKIIKNQNGKQKSSYFLSTMRLSIIILKGTEFKRKKKKIIELLLVSRVLTLKTKQNKNQFSSLPTTKKNSYLAEKKNVSLGFSKPLDLHLTHYYYS